MTTTHDMDQLVEDAKQALIDGGEFINIAEACQLTGLGYSTIRGYIASGRLIGYRVSGGRGLRVKRSDLDALFTRIEPTLGD
jgi:excisionase family DNA binding protein